MTLREIFKRKRWVSNSDYSHFETEGLPSGIRSLFHQAKENALHLMTSNLMRSAPYTSSNQECLIVRKMRNDSIDLAKKILELLDDPERKKRMGEFGYNRVKNELEWQYEKENICKAYRRVFDMDE